MHHRPFDYWIDAHRMRITAITGLLAIVALIALCLVLAPPANAQTAPSGTISVSPMSLTAPGPVTITWNVTNAVGTAPCTASGGWSGSKPASGSQTVTVSASASFTLSCTGATETALLSWTEPTLNTDGSALTPSAYVVTEGTDGISFPNSVTVPAPATGYPWANLSPGVHYWRVATVRQDGVQGDPTNAVQRTLLALPWSGSAAVTMNSLPNPPTNFAVTVATVAYELRGYSNGTFRFVQIGTVPLGAPCGIALAAGYHAFDGATVTKATTGGIRAARCQAAG